jgi:hypothetical protein
MGVVTRPPAAGVGARAFSSSVSLPPPLGMLAPFAVRCCPARCQRWR